MTKERVTQIINEHGLCYADSYVAQEFANLTGQPVSSVMSILSRQERINVNAESGRGKWERAREGAVMALAQGWETESNRNAAEVVATYELATAYAILVRRSIHAAQEKSYHK